MLFTKCSLFILVALLLLESRFVSTLPVFGDNDSNNDIFANKQPSNALLSSEITTTSTTTAADEVDDIITDTNKDDDDFYLDLNRFAQLVSTHIMVEHLESAVTALSKKLAAQIEASVELVTRQPSYASDDSTGKAEGQQWIRKDKNNNDDVDVRLLKEQLQGAVGSYVEDQLPNMWYSHHSFAALDSVSMRLFMETTLLDTCPPINTNRKNNDGDDNSSSNSSSSSSSGNTISGSSDVNYDDNEEAQQNTTINHRCFKANAAAFSRIVDDYIKQHMQSTLADIVQQDLPQLLSMTDNHVHAILQHFNTFLLPPHSQLQMSFLSLQDHPDWSSMNSINDILDSIAAGENNSNDSLIHSIHQYAIQAKSNSY